MSSRAESMWIVACAAVLGGCYVSSVPADPPPPPPEPRPDAGPPPDSGPLPTVESDGAAPVAGGSMALTASGLAVAADVQTDTLFVFDPAGDSLRGSVSLGDAVEPGRVAIDAAGRAQVLLRATGELATVDLDTLTITRRAICGAPRGLAVDGGSLLVTCAGGELMTIPAAGGAPTQTVFVEPDLRDVLIGDGVLYVSRFRSAELLTLDREGRILARRRPEARTSDVPRRDPSLGPVEMVPNVAYRIRSMPDGRVAMLHQRSQSSPIDVGTEGYSGGECGTGVVEAALSFFPADGGPPTSTGALMEMALAVDFAVLPTGDEVVVTGAGIPSMEAMVPIAPTSGVMRYAGFAGGEPCFGGRAVTEEPAVAAEVTPDGRIVTLHHTGSTLFTTQAPTTGAVGHRLRPAVPALDRGYELFHAQTPSGVACASCHPEGGEDGHVWDFQPTGPRRTQTLLGGLLDTAPFHWNGDQPDMTAIMIVTFTDRMAGLLGPSDVAAISAYLDRQPMPMGSATDVEAIARGHALFEGEAGCASCHAGETLTSDETLDVGTGGAFQVPTMRGVWLRAPFMHDGCAPTLEAVLTDGCGVAGGHGDAAGLSASQRSDLIAYLRSL